MYAVDFLTTMENKGSLVSQTDDSMFVRFPTKPFKHYVQTDNETIMVYMDSVSKAPKLSMKRKRHMQLQSVTMTFSHLPMPVPEAHTTSVENALEVLRNCFDTLDPNSPIESPSSPSTHSSMDTTKLRRLKKQNSELLTTIKRLQHIIDSNNMHMDKKPSGRVESPKRRKTPTRRETPKRGTPVQMPRVKATPKKKIERSPKKKKSPKKKSPQLGRKSPNVNKKHSNLGRKSPQPKKKTPKKTPTKTQAPPIRKTPKRRRSTKRPASAMMNKKKKPVTPSKSPHTSRRPSKSPSRSPTRSPQKSPPPRQSSPDDFLDVPPGGPWIPAGAPIRPFSAAHRRSQTTYVQKDTVQDHLGNPKPPPKRPLSSRQLRRNSIQVTTRYTINPKKLAVDEKYKNSPYLEVKKKKKPKRRRSAIPKSSVDESLFQSPPVSPDSGRLTHVL
mmetsp:Transcript_4999/g.7415  ORF Transcript_4999/g.7415 Transcript_4999/m.7415 type:complete len:442 (+) Transcript_4999:56-1381(+)